MRRFLFVVFAIFLVGASVAQIQAAERMRLATTTSTYDTGLLDVILPPFEKKFNVKVDVISVGTGKAIRLAENGDADVILVHARDAEDKFVNEGYGVNRRDVMYNDFLIIGPKGDPAGTGGTKGAVAALKAIAKAKAPFVSRGDDSGTHKKEKKLWKEAGISPKGKWYMEAGQGMGATLNIADEKNAYCLTDRATFTAFEDKIKLRALCEGDKRLLNQYGIIAVSPAKHPDASYLNAMCLIGWITSPEVQKMIGDFKKKGTTLFHPDAYHASPMRTM
jgi:tungstate transport system substrate-binding protein